MPLVLRTWPFARVLIVDEECSATVDDRPSDALTVDRADEKAAKIVGCRLGYEHWLLQAIGWPPSVSIQAVRSESGCPDLRSLLVQCSQR